MPVYLRRILYALLGLVALVLLLVAGVFVYLQTDSGQDFAARKAESYLRDKLQTDVRIAKFRTDFKHAISLDGVYLEDQKGDTLLSVGHLGIDLDLWALTKSQINLKSLELNDGRLAITRTEPDSISNYDFIVKAFATGDTTTVATTPADTTGAGFQYNIGDLRLTNILLTYNDQVDGMNVRTRVGELAVSMDEVDVDGSTYRVDQAALRNTGINIRQTKVPPDTPQDTAALKLEFGLNRAQLQNVSLTYRNDPSAQFINTRIGEADVTADNIDLVNSQVTLNTLKLRNTSFAYAQNENVPVEQRVVNPAEAVRDLNAAVENATGQEASWVVSLKQSDITGVDVAFDNFNEPRQRTKVRGMDYNHLKFTNLTLNTENLRYSADSTTGRITQLAGQEQSGFAITRAAAQVHYDDHRIQLNDLDLVTPHSHLKRRIGIGYKDLAGIADDLPNLKLNGDLREARLGFRDVLYITPTLIDTPPFSSGPNQSFLISGLVSGRLGDLRVQNLDFVGFRNTVVRGGGRIQGLPNTDDRLILDLNLGYVRTTEADMRSLLPAGTLPELGINPNAPLVMSGQIRGRISNLALTNIDFRGLQGTRIRTTGRLIGLPNTDRRLYADFNIREFTSTAADIKGLLPAGTLPAGYQLPPRLTVSGTFRGRPTALIFDTNLRATTSFGNLTAKVNVGEGPQGQEPVAATFSTQGLDVGKFLGDPTIGKVTASGTLNGRGGLDPNQLRGQLNATVQQATYNGYTYRGITAKVDIDRNRYVVNASSKDDPNLNLDLLATIDLRNASNPTYTVDRLNLRGANLTALGFYTGGDLRVQGDLTANISGSDLNTINGTFSGNRIVIVNNNRPFALDSVSGRIVQRTGRTEVDFASSVADLTLRGNTRLGDLALELQRHIDRYFDLPGVQFRPSSEYRQFTFEANLKQPRLVQQLVPDLKRLTPFKLTGSYDSRAADLRLNTRIGRIVYMGYALDSLKLAVQSDPQKLDYALGLRQISQDTTLQIPNPSLQGSVQNNEIGTRLRIAESDSAEKLNLAGALRVLNQGTTYAFRFDPKLMLDEKQWDITPNNEIRYTTSSGALFAQNLVISRNQRRLSLQTLAGPQYPLQVNMVNLDINGLGRAAGFQDSLIAGTLNGQAIAYSLGQPRQAFTANANLAGFVYNKAAIGDLAVQATNPTPDRYNVDARLTNQQGMDVRAVGYYLATPPSPIQFDVNVNRLDLRIIEPFSLGQLQQMGGGVSGQLAVTGSVSQPNINGTLTTTPDATFTLTQLGAPYFLASQDIDFTNQGIGFDNFVVKDSVGNQAVINGAIRTRDYVSDFRFDLQATTTNFLAIQSSRRENNLFWGKLLVDSDSRITGTLNLPVVRTRARVADGSNFFVGIPNDDPVKVERDGIVEFVDKSAPIDTMLTRQVAIDSAETAAGYDIQALVTVTDNTPFTIVVDEASGDNLRVQANGTLNTAIDPTGNITLTGRLDVTQGKYQMSLYDLASREFDIARGSSITWSGDPYNGQANVTAVYKVRAAPAELISSQGGTDETQNALARNQLPFEVDLKVTGQLLKPLISFDIRLPEEARSDLRGPIEARLTQLRQPSQESELNKQVFSLLVLNRFLADDPFKSSSGNLVAEQLRGSASQVLTQQLNNLTGSYLSNLGVELGVNSYADFSSGAEKTRTDLNVAVRRQLLNNRLTVRLGTDVPLGGGNQSSTGPGQSSVSAFAGDVSVEYNVLANGRIRLQAFRNNAYGDIDGQFVRTGASLIFQRDYRDLADLFKGIDETVKEEVKLENRRRRQDRRANRDSTNAAPNTPRRDSTRLRPVVARPDSARRTAARSAATRPDSTRR
ncbi:translocation/assembly module TamB domain-containing protein [Hymenobacter sublimis]|uniref:Translocation/assembly module TamB domain-containing protein n=1 Tax=Hymenobacter sublimis TaxID=2933777 RepID=A0ABY4J7W0_9BACT|nr:translocation/assembly module TamB [Hymenobacter sublimis]UPL48910.1 translocation/assembly module TamB domain-containing protein [Hymenobacter sublimis]